MWKRICFSNHDVINKLITSLSYRLPGHRSYFWKGWGEWWRQREKSNIFISALKRLLRMRPPIWVSSESELLPGGHWLKWSCLVHGSVVARFVGFPWSWCSVIWGFAVLEVPSLCECMRQSAVDKKALSFSETIQDNLLRKKLMIRQNSCFIYSCFLINKFGSSYKNLNQNKGSMNRLIKDLKMVDLVLTISIFGKVQVRLYYGSLFYDKNVWSGTGPVRCSLFGSKINYWNTKYCRFAREK